MTTDPTSTPRLAATVILLREVASGNVEVLLLKRHGKSGFFGNAYAFPGGRLDATDGIDAMRTHCVADDAQKAVDLLKPTPGLDLSAGDALGLWVAGCRELFEEAGVLLACDHEGRSWQAGDEPTPQLLRTRLHSGEVSFAEVLAEVGARLDLAALHYWAHWVTPSGEGKRYDARFFWAVMPSGQIADNDAIETTEHRWMTPAAVLAGNQAGDMLLPPPTLHLIDELDKLISVGGLEAIRAAAQCRDVAPVMPKLTSIGSKPAIVLPWDCDYATTAGEAFVGNIDYGADLQNSPSRVVLTKAGWQLG